MAVFQRTGVAMTAGFCVFAMAAIGGFAAGFGARTGLGAALAPAEISAADNVSLRFPSDWSEAPSGPVGLAYASADASLPLFDPTPTYPIAAEAAVVAETTSSVPAQAPEPKMQLASLAKPANPVRAVHRSNAVLNESQLASIKKRLNLSPDQERYWPAIAAELRKMEYKKDHRTGTQTAAVDMSKVNVEGLKSAGFPLVMSFSDDQRRELKSLAHLLGLESVLSTF
jgi:hypothetical protein